MDLIASKVQNKQQGSEIWDELQLASIIKKKKNTMKEIESQQIYISILFLVQNSTLTQILDFSACAQHHFQIMNEHDSLRPQSLFRFFFFHLHLIHFCTTALR